MGGQVVLSDKFDRGGLDHAISKLSAKDVQDRVNDVLLLEALAEQLTPTQAPDATAAHTGRIALGAQVG